MAESNKKQLSMADRRKAIKELYNDDIGVRTYVRKANSSGAASAYTETNLNNILNAVGSSNTNLINLQQQLTDYAYSTNSNYSNIIDYFANMYLWRYYYIPVAKKERSNSASYEEIYNLMTEIIDGLHLEVLYPTILTSLFKDGIVFIYTEKNTPSKTISTYVLNKKYCEPVMMSQYGTGIYQFNAKYFEDLGLRSEELDVILDMYPKELSEGYRAYKAGGPQYFILDGRYASFFRLNEYNFPTRLAMIKSIFDYNNYRANEVERNSAQLDKIISHKIPSYEDQLLFEIDEVKELHSSMSRQISSNTRTKLVTTFGDLEVHYLAENDKIQNEILEKAHNAIYQNAGLNTEVFNGKSEEALMYSLDRDAALVWKYVDQITNFYNLTINNLYNFKGYQAELVILPITHYNSSESISSYKSNAEYGVGRLELIVASGTKQKHITPKAELEKYLKLEEILKPLQSSHTQSGNIKDSEEEEKDENPEIKKDNEEENE